MVLIYVDDMIVTGSNEFSLNKFTKKLQSLFAFKDMCNLHHFLGIEVNRDETRM